MVAVRLLTYEKGDGMRNWEKICWVYVVEITVGYKNCQTQAVIDSYLSSDITSSL
jgi:hypothetical protein